jgi:hypothetical protein
VRERDRIVAIHGVSKILVQRHFAEWPPLREQHGRDVVLRVDPEQCVRGPIPEELADRARGSCASFGGATRTAKSMPKPTCPLDGSQDFSVTSFGIASVAMSLTVSGFKMRARTSLPPPNNMRANFM